MVILHLASIVGLYYLWGERPAEEGTFDSTRRKCETDVPLSKPHPYDTGFEVLVSILEQLSSGLNPAKKKSQTLTAWLPTKGSNPIPSSPLIADPPDSRTKARLTPWSIDAYPLSVEETVGLLCLSMGKHTLAAGVVVGTDLAYWAQSLKFAGSLVARQQYLPGIMVQGTSFRAQWEPVLVGECTRQLNELAKLMPPAARALTSVEATSPPQTSSLSNLKQFINAAVDYLVRISSAGQAGQTNKYRKNTPAFDSVHDAWLDALQSSGGIIRYDSSELVQLVEQVRQWHRPMVLSATSPIRLCFRLEEPQQANETDNICAGGAENSWYVRYLLQPHDDQSLLIPLEDVWKTQRRKASVLKHYEEDIHECLLSSLGQAAGICPNIEASLKTAEPAGYELDTTNAHQFLVEKAILLEQAGFGVMLPAWWTRKGTKMRLVARANVKSPKMQGGNGLSLGEIVQFNWEIALGDKKLSLTELQALAKLKAPLVRVRGQWVQMNTAEIQAAIDFWTKKGSEQATVQDIIRMALGAKDAAGGFEFKGIKASGWVGKLLKQLDGRTAFEQIAAPEAFCGTLRPYQWRGYSWLAFLRQWGLGACLADDMGLGKTIQALALIQRDWESNGKRPVLLVCPTSVINNWRKEAARFTPGLPVLVHHGSDREKGAAFGEQARNHAIVISSYALLHRDIEFLRDVPWAGVVLDEAQNIKNPETKQSRAARSFEVDYRVALTGTPVENNIGDLWSIMEFLNPGLLGIQAEFKRTFFVPIQAGRDPQAADRLKHITGPFILRRLKTDKSVIADLPDKQEMKVFCTLTKEQASLYAAVLEEAEETMESADGIQRKGVILGTLSKLKQVCNHPAQLLGDNSSIPGRSGKLTRLTEMLEEIIEVGDRALIFSQFAEMGAILQRHLQETFGQEVFFLHGGVPKCRRDRMVEHFQGKCDGPSIFILSLKAGGTGLNLTQANHVFHFDRWWNPAVENQATDRAFRIGQARNVQVHKFICAGTLEDKIDEMIERKKEIAGDVIGTGEGWLTELSNEELKDVFALRKEAVAE